MPFLHCDFDILPIEKGYLVFGGFVFFSEFGWAWSGTPLQYACLENPVDEGAW